MSQAIVDPDEVKTFRNSLVRAVQTMVDNARTTQQSFESLSSYWRDEKNQRFSQIFQETMRSLDGFTRRSEDYVNYLVQVETTIRKYLEQSY